MEHAAMPSSAIVDSDPAKALSGVKIAFTGYDRCHGSPSSSKVTAKTSVGGDKKEEEDDEHRSPPSLAAVEELARTHGATLVDGVGQRTDILVAWRGLTAKRLVADQLRIPVVTADWFVSFASRAASPSVLPPSLSSSSSCGLPSGAAALKDTLRSRKSNAQGAARPSPLPSPPPLLHGYEFYASNTSHSEWQALKEILERHGGTLAREMTIHCDAVLLTAEYAAELKEINAFFEKQERRRRRERGEEQKQRRRAGRNLRDTAAAPPHGAATRDGDGRHAEAPEDEEAEAVRKEAQLFGTIPRRIRFAWVNETPVVEFQKLVAMAELSSAAEEVNGQIPFAPSRCDFAAICSTACLLPSDGLRRLLEARHAEKQQALGLANGHACGDSAHLPLPSSPRSHAAVRAGGPHMGRGDQTPRSSPRSSSCSSSSSSSETTVSIASSYVTEPDGFEGPVLDLRHYQYGEAPAGNCLHAHEEEEDHTLSSQFADHFSPFPPAGAEADVEDGESTTRAWEQPPRPPHPPQQQQQQQQQQPTARDIVQKYYVTIRSGGTGRTEPVASAPTAGGMSGAVPPRRPRAIPSLTLVHSGGGGGGDECGNEGIDTGNSNSNNNSDSGIANTRGDRAGTGAGRRPLSSSLFFFVPPFYLRHPPFLSVCFIGCVGKEGRDAARMAHACRFLVCPMPTSETDVVVLGRLAVSKKVHFVAKPPQGDVVTAGGNEESRDGGQQRPQRSRPPLPSLRDAAAEANHKRRRMLKAMHARKKGDLVQGAAEPIYFYEVGFEVAASLKESFGIPKHRLAPLAWLRACYRKVQEKLTAAQALREEAEENEDEEEGESLRMTFGFGETFKERVAGSTQPPSQPHRLTAAGGCGDSRAESLDEQLLLGLAPGGFAPHEQLPKEEREQKEGSPLRAASRAAALTFDPDPPLAEWETPNPHDAAFRVLIARPATSPFFAASTNPSDTANMEPIKENGAEGTTGSRHRGRDNEVSQTETRQVPKRREGGKERERQQRHGANEATSPAATVNSSSLVVPVLVHADEDAASTISTRAPGLTASQIAQRDVKEAKVLLAAFHELLLLSPSHLMPPLSALPDGNESVAPSPATALLLHHQRNVFKRAVFCFIDGEFARPFLGALRAIISQGGGANVKLPREQWRALPIAPGKRNTQQDGSAKVPGDGALLDAVRKNLVFGKRKRYVFGSVLSRAKLGNEDGATFPPVTTSGTATPAFTRAREEVRVLLEKQSSSPSAREDDDVGLRGGPAPVAETAAAAAAVAALKRARTAVVRSGVVALYVLPRAHERSPCGGGEAKSSNGNSNEAGDDDAVSGKPPLRFIPAVTSDYLLCSLAAGHLVDPTACFLFHCTTTTTAAAAEEEATAVLLRARRHRVGSGSNNKNATSTHYDLRAPKLSAWQEKRRYEKKHVGVAVSFLWILPKEDADAAGGEGYSDGDVLRVEKEKEKDGNAGRSAWPEGRATSALCRVLFSGLSRVVRNCLGGTVCDRYSSDTVTHAVVVDVAAIVSSSLGHCFLAIDEDEKAAQGVAAAEANEGTVIWPLAEARAAAADTRKNAACLVSDDWLQDCLPWRCFIDETGEGSGKAGGYSRASVVDALLEKADIEARERQQQQQQQQARNTSAQLATPPQARRGAAGSHDDGGADASSTATPLRRGAATPSQRTPAIDAVFHFHTPGSTPLPSRVHPAPVRESQQQEQQQQQQQPQSRQPRASAASDGSSANGGPLDGPMRSPLPLFPNHTQCSENGRDGRHGDESMPASQRCRGERGKVVRTLRAASVSQGTSHETPASSCNRLPTESPIARLDAAMEMRKSAGHPSLLLHRRRHSRSTAQGTSPRHSQPSLAEDSNSKLFGRDDVEEEGQQQTPNTRSSLEQVVSDDEEKGTPPQVTLFSTDNSLSQAPQNTTNITTTVTSNSSNSNRRKRQREETVEEERQRGAGSALVLAQCTYESLSRSGGGVDSSAEEEADDAPPLPPWQTAPAGVATPPAVAAARTSTTGSLSVRGQHEEEEEDEATRGRSTRLTDSQEPMTQDEGNEADHQKRGAARKMPRLAYAPHSPSPQGQHMAEERVGMMVNGDEEVDVDAEEEGNATGNAVSEAQAAQKKATGTKASARTDTLLDSARGESPLFAVYLVGDLPGRENFLHQYHTVVERLLPTLPTKGAAAAMPAQKQQPQQQQQQQRGPLRWVRVIGEADCVVCHELTPRETVLAAIAAGLWLVQPAFLREVIAVMTKSKRCDELLGKRAPALVQLLKLHEWGPRVVMVGAGRRPPLSSSRSPTPPPPPPQQQQQQQPQQQPTPISEWDMRIALAHQCVRRRCVRQEEACSSGEAEKRHKVTGIGKQRSRGGVFEQQHYLLFFAPFDSVRDGSASDADSSSRANGPATRRISTTSPTPEPTEKDDGSDEKRKAQSASGAPPSRMESADPHPKSTALCLARHGDRVAKKNETLRTILLAGGASVPFAGPLLLRMQQQPHKHKRAKATPAPVVDECLVLQQLTATIVEAVLRPLSRSKRSCQGTERDGEVEEPTLLDKEVLCVTFDSSLLRCCRVRCGERGSAAGATPPLAAWLTSLLLWDANSNETRQDSTSTSTPTLRDMYDCVQLARQHVLAEYEKHRKAYHTSRGEDCPETAAGEMSQKENHVRRASANAWVPPREELRQRGLGVMPAPKLALVESRSNRADKQSGKGGDGVVAGCLRHPCGGKVSTWASQLFAAVRQREYPSEEPLGSVPSSSSSSPLSSVYVVPQCVVFKDMACVALEIADLRDAATDPGRLFGSMTF